MLCYLSSTTFLGASSSFSFDALLEASSSLESVFLLEVSSFLDGFPLIERGSIFLRETRLVFLLPTEVVIIQR